MTEWDRFVGCLSVNGWLGRIITLQEMKIHSDCTRAESKNSNSNGQPSSATTRYSMTLTNHKFRNTEKLCYWFITNASSSITNDHHLNLPVMPKTKVVLMMMMTMMMFTPHLCGINFPKLTPGVSFFNDHGALWHISDVLLIRMIR